MNRKRFDEIFDALLRAFEIRNTFLIRRGITHLIEGAEPGLLQDDVKTLAESMRNMKEFEDSREIFEGLLDVKREPVVLKKRKGWVPVAPPVVDADRHTDPCILTQELFPPLDGGDEREITPTKTLYRPRNGDKEDT